MLTKPSRIDELIKQGWLYAMPGNHPLGDLQSLELGSHKLLVMVGPKNRVGADYFVLFLKDQWGRLSREPVLVGIFSRGEYPSHNWIEVVKSAPSSSFDGSSTDVDLKLLAPALFGHLSNILPPGSHIMLEYESTEHQETARGLATGIHPAATPLGHLLFSIGFGAGFKDWYFPEGGCEGPRKIEGRKALNPEHAQQKTRELRAELEDFLDRTSETTSKIQLRARLRATGILQKLDEP